MESGEDMDTEAMVKLMKASHFMAISIDKQDDGDLAVTVLLADEIGRPVHKLSESAAGLEAVSRSLWGVKKPSKFWLRLGRPVVTRRRLKPLTPRSQGAVGSLIWSIVTKTSLGLAPRRDH